MLKWNVRAKTDRWTLRKSYSCYPNQKCHRGNYLFFSFFCVCFSSPLSFVVFYSRLRMSLTKCFGAATLFRFLLTLKQVSEHRGATCWESCLSPAAKMNTFRGRQHDFTYWLNGLCCDRTIDLKEVSFYMDTTYCTLKMFAFLLLYGTSDECY